MSYENTLYFVDGLCFSKSAKLPSSVTSAVAEGIKAVTFQAMKLSNREMRDSIPSGIN
ncbi:hypothetical protein HOLleu_14477 [Holothuria leucospilota]|uniref:Uncharacterized protein n=1 Tax=Holothuria leucospilota TaxID=206669 RepID=A0A9Q1H8Z2_HOLLE|nr:hypothetical protein HOLleu_14477 [Holothuria leucospilota]